METKRTKVIMLPTKDNSIICTNNGVLEKKVMTWSTPYTNICGTKPQHLYFINDDEIKVGDWYLAQTYPSSKTNKYQNQKPCQFKESERELLNKYRSITKKIIATTDILPDYKAGIDVGLFLPQPSKAFIEKYCELGGIDEVLVEYNWVNARCSLCGFGKDSNECINRKECPKKYFGGKEILKVDSHNTITIHPIKDNWNKEEVESLLFSLAEHYAMTSTKGEIEDFNNWIKNNL